MSLEQPNPKLPNPQPLAKEEEEQPEQTQVQDEEEEDDVEDKKKSFSPKKRISVTMYGAISGQYKCEICTAAHKFFNNPAQWKKFTYKHVDIMSDKGMKVAKQKGFDKMPFFRYRRPGETTDEWIEGFIQKEWDEMQV